MAAAPADPALVHHLALLIPAAYLIGSIPFGLLVGLARGVDVRTVGSKNIGSTNVGRTVGKKFGYLVLLLDLLKGLAPMLAASAIVGHAVPDVRVYGLWMGVGFAAILGHVFSLFLRFTGGKGVATTAGVVLGLWPYFTLPCLVMVSVYLILSRATRYISVGSIGGAMAFPVSYVGFGLVLGWDPLGRQWPLTVFSLAVATLVVWKHRANISRLLAGEENRK